jgi:hypothetical protein
MADVLVCALRRIALQQTQLAKATCGTIRLKLLKLGALVRTSMRHHIRDGLGLPLPPRLRPRPHRPPAARRRVDSQYSGQLATGFAAPQPSHPVLPLPVLTTGRVEEARRPGGLQLHAGTEGLQTPCWREVDSNLYGAFRVK